VLPDVELLQGTDDLDEWLVSMRAKLHVDGAAIGDEFARFHYVYSRLAPGPKRTMLPYVKRAQEANACVAEAFVAYVQSTFEDPNKVKKAGQRLTKIRQGRRSIAAYIPEFERKLFEARADEWPDDARIILLVASLNRETQDRLEGKDWPETYAQFTAFLRRQESAFVSTSETASTVADRQSDDDPMDVDINRARVPVRKSRLLKDQCARCGKKGHWAKDCKMPKPVKPNDTPTGRPVGVKTTQTSSSRAYRHWEVQSDSDSDDDEEWPEDI
jgi:hypothetical protein